MVTSTPEPPDFFTIEEAARVLRIGRTAAYELARTWRQTEGREGLPVVAFGRLLRVPRTALESLSGGPVSVPRPGRTPRQCEPAVETEVREPARRVRADVPRHKRRRHPRPRSVSSDQTQFPFT
jgi:hypothetical protein